MSTKKKVAPAAPAATDEAVVSFKGFDVNLSCRGYQFKIGKTYDHDGNVEACSSGFHACEYPLNVFDYYAPGVSRFAQVTQSRALSRHDGDTKIASGRITIDVELKIPEFVAAAVKWVTDRVDWEDATVVDGERQGAVSKGDRSASSATGDRSASSATGYRSASSATGYRSASSATGDQSASSATGDQSASSATGYQSASSATGDRSASSATGYQSASSATGYRSASSATGDKSAAMAVGSEGRVMGAEGCALFLVYRDPNTFDIKHAWAGVAGRNGIKPLTWYTLDASGQMIEVAP